MKDRKNSFNENVNSIARLLIKKKHTIAVAESVTAGNLQTAFSLAENATLFFQGGITVYNIGQKCRLLNVEPIHAASCNCVSQKVSDELALNVAEMFLADYAIGVTGYAAPFPQENIEALFAYVSVAKQGDIIGSKKIISPKQPPQQVQEFYASEIMSFMLKIVEKQK